jgi:hypothetical protein
VVVGASARSVLRAETQLKPADCCVLLAAEDARARSVLTFDDQLGATASQLGLVSASDD